jgi:hypothetical protein
MSGKSVDEDASNKLSCMHGIIKFSVTALKGKVVVRYLVRGSIVHLLSAAGLRRCWLVCRSSEYSFSRSRITCVRSFKISKTRILAGNEQLLTAICPIFPNLRTISAASLFFYRLDAQVPVFRGILREDLIPCFSGSRCACSI